MATNNTTSNRVPSAPMSAGSEEWTEERIEAALKRLKLLHIQLRNLRTTVPRMIQPMSANLTSPEALYMAFEASTTKAYTDLGEFKTLMTEDQTKKLFQRAEQSRNEKPKGIKPWRARDDPDWLTMDTT